MSLSWISIALTFTAVFIWWFGNNQPLGFAIFMTGGILWFIAQKIESVEKKLEQRLEQESESKSKNLEEEK
jgi:hypothetical protein